MYTKIVAVNNGDGSVTPRAVVSDRVEWRSMRRADNMARSLRRRGFKTLVFDQDDYNNTWLMANHQSGLYLIRGA